MIRSCFVVSLLYGPFRLALCFSILTESVVQGGLKTLIATPIPSPFTHSPFHFPFPYTLRSTTSYTVLSLE